MINNGYLKKLKKRLSDLTEYFQVKGERNEDENGEVIAEERRMHYFEAAR